MTEFHDIITQTDADRAAEIDAGILARERVEAKRFKRNRTLMRIFTCFLITIFGGLAAAGYRVYVEVQKPGVRYTDYRQCKYEDLENKVELTGIREYSYKQKEFFGIQYRQGSEVLEKTSLDVRGTAMSIVGLQEGSWKSVYVGEGERGIQLLMPAELYVVTVGKKAAVFNYADFCK